jgi:aryl-alcohol dehydrogenase-like predicted oxidoreductase
MLGRVFIDTSPIYGNGFSEIVIGNFLSQSKGRYFLATKYYPNDYTTANNVIQSVEGSLSRLKIDKVDLIQLHWPNPLANMNEVVEGLNVLFEQGKIGGLGSCNFSQAEILDLITIWPRELITNQQEINLNNVGARHEYLDPTGARTMSYGTLIQGRFTFSEVQRKYINDVATQINLTPAAMTLKILSLLDPEIIPILKISSVKHLNELVEGLNQELDESILVGFNKIDKIEISYLDPKKIKLIGDKTRNPYLSSEEALRNLLQLFPSPASIAERIRKFNLILPIKVRTLSGGLFEIDSEDPFDQVKKYWAWLLAYPETKIPAIIFETRME